MSSPNLAPFASLQLAPWNTATTEVEMFAQRLFHRASHLHCLRFCCNLDFEFLFNRHTVGPIEIPGTTD